jgi:hypothetical protein
MVTSLPLVCGNATKFRMLMFVQCFSQKFWQTIADIDTLHRELKTGCNALAIHWLFVMTKLRMDLY